MLQWQLERYNVLRRAFLLAGACFSSIAGACFAQMMSQVLSAL